MTTGANLSKSPVLRVTTSPDFSAWLIDQRVSFAFTTYEVGKLFLVGLEPNGKLSLFERTFNRSMALCVADAGDANCIWMSSLYQLWKFQNALAPRQEHNGFDRLYVPQVGFTTGDVDLHDVAVDSTGRAVFVSTLFSCLATTSETHSFAPIWRPPFVSELAPEDRCHLNGLAMELGRPRFVTAVAATDSAEGWRSHRNDGGIVMDCQADEIVASGLSMPHSPRFHRNALWLLDAGSGYFGRVETQKGTFHRLTFCPGFLRGLSFVGDYALVTTSKPRDNATFGGLPLDRELAARGTTAMCQIAVIDLRSFEIVHWLRLEGLVNELYDVVTLAGVRRPMALGFKTNEIHRTLSIDDQQPL